MRLLWSIEHGLQRASKRMENSLGITGPQRLALKIIRKFPGVSVSTLAHILHLHPSTISGVLQRLVEKDLLVREDDPADRRRARLRVKETGRRFADQPTGTVEAAIARALSHLPAAHVDRARDVLWAIASELDATNS